VKAPDLSNEWAGMPICIQKKQRPCALVKAVIGSQAINVRFETRSDFDNFSSIAPKYYGGVFYFDSIEQAAEKLKQKITPKTKSVWYPFKPHCGGIKYKYVASQKIQPRYPVYIVSKGRWRNGLTTKALNSMGVEHFIVVEESERKMYEDHTSAPILVLPQYYLDNYDTCDKFGDTKSRGPGAARNFCLDHSRVLGFKKHWVMDDNLDAFHYLNNNEKYEVECGNTLAAAEDFVDRYSNVPIAGLNYYSFVKKTDAVPPFITNTRIYSCLLIENDAGYRWRARYNEDTDICLRVLKDGLCTIQFNAFLCGKVTTQRMSGGNTKEFYKDEGTLPKSQMLADLHPDVASVVWRFNRWHHHVDYRPFKGNKLIKKEPQPNHRGEYFLKKVAK
jgi:hypothetical protein